MVVNSQDKNCPILLENVTFGILSEYLVSKTNQTEGAAYISTRYLLSVSRYKKERNENVCFHKESVISVDNLI